MSDREKVPLGRMEHPEDAAKVIGFLAFDRAEYMTGQAINVTGGLIMHCAMLLCPME